MARFSLAAPQATNQPAGTAGRFSLSSASARPSASPQPLPTIPRLPAPSFQQNLGRTLGATNLVTGGSLPGLGAATSLLSLFNRFNDPRASDARLALGTAGDVSNLAQQASQFEPLQSLLAPLTASGTLPSLTGTGIGAWADLVPDWARSFLSAPLEGGEAVRSGLDIGSNFSNTTGPVFDELSSLTPEAFTSARTALEALGSATLDTPAGLSILSQMAARTAPFPITVSGASMTPQQAKGLLEAFHSGTLTEEALQQANQFTQAFANQSQALLRQGLDTFENLPIGQQIEVLTGSEPDIISDLVGNLSGATGAGLAAGTDLGVSAGMEGLDVATKAFVDAYRAALDAGATSAQAVNAGTTAMGNLPTGSILSGVGGVLGIGSGALAASEGNIPGAVAGIGGGAAGLAQAAGLLPAGAAAMIALPLLLTALAAGPGEGLAANLGLGSLFGKKDVMHNKQREAKLQKHLAAGAISHMQNIVAGGFQVPDIVNYMQSSDNLSNQGFAGNTTAPFRQAVWDKMVKTLLDADPQRFGNFLTSKFDPAILKGYEAKVGTFEGPRQDIATGGDGGTGGYYAPGASKTWLPDLGWTALNQTTRDSTAVDPLTKMPTGTPGYLGPSGIRWGAPGVESLQNLVYDSAGTPGIQTEAGVTWLPNMPRLPSGWDDYKLAQANAVNVMGN